MTKSTYSFGEESPLKFQISDKTAKLYNEAVQEFFRAQQRFNQKFGRKWNPVTDPIRIRWSRAQRKAWNDFGKTFNEMVKKEGPFHENDILEDFLVKNVAVAASVTSTKWDHLIPLAVLGGVLYGLLNRRQSLA